MDDIKLIPLIIKNADEVKVSPNLNNKGKKVIIYKKEIGDIYYYLEYLIGGGYLDTQTMHKNKINK